MRKPQPSAEDIRDALRYDGQSGLLYWTATIGRRIKIGDVAGCVSDQGYVVIGFRGGLLRAHRLVWAIVTGRWPDELIDHINGDRQDNRWANLREAGAVVNSQNQRTAHANSKSGLLGVHENHLGFKAQIRHAGTRYQLGHFKTAEAAHVAYLKAKRALHEGNTL